MRKIVLALAVAMLPALASAGASRHRELAQSRYVTFSVWALATSGTQALSRFVYPFPGGGRLVNVILYQYAAGTGGTSVAISVRNAAVENLLSTAAVATLASGASVSTDSAGSLALPAGWTRPVLGTAAATTVAYGGYFDILATETGTYSAHPQLLVTLVFQPLQ
jgi:hypothetical protein